MPNEPLTTRCLISSSQHLVHIVGSDDAHKSETPCTHYCSVQVISRFSTLQSLWNQCGRQQGSDEAHKSETSCTHHYCSYTHSFCTLQTLWNQCDRQEGSGDANKRKTLYHIITLQTLWNQCERQEGSGDTHKRKHSTTLVHCKHCGTSVGVRRDLEIHTRGARLDPI